MSCAVGVLNRRGVRGMTLGEVASGLGLVPTGVIYYFRNKEELAQACFLKGVAEYEAYVAQGEAGAEPRERVALFLWTYLEALRRIAEGAQEPLPVFNDVRALNAPAVNEAYVALFRRLRGLIEGGQGWSRPQLNARTHLLLSEVFWAAAWLRRRDAEDYPGVAPRMIGMVCDGLAGEKAAWAPIALPCLMAERSDHPAEMFLRAATELMNEEGYVGASVEKISARLNVTKGAFYHHHTTKDDLVLACFERTFQAMRLAIRQAEAVAASGYQALISVACALVEFQMSGNSPLLRTTALSSAPEAMQPQLLDQFDRISYRFASMISDGIADGSIRPVEANVAAQMISGMINAAADLRFWVPSASAETVAELYVRPFFEGLLGQGEGRG